MKALWTSHQLLGLMHKVQVVKSKGRSWGLEIREMIKNQPRLKSFNLNLILTCNIYINKIHL